MMFECRHCGCCCRNLDKSDIYAPLDRGDGICRFLSGNDCTIYEKRPLLCRVDESYDCYFHLYVSREKYYEGDADIFLDQLPLYSPLLIMLQ